MSRLMMCALLVMGLGVSLLGQSPAELLAQADALFQEVWLTQFTPSAAPALQAKLETAIRLYEQVLAQDANNVPALNMLSRSYYTLADVFLPNEDKAAAHAIGQEYGKRALRTDPEFVRVEAERGFVEAVGVSNDLEALYWTYCNWARRVELGGVVGLLMAALRGDDRKLVALIERCLELDRGYTYGGPLRSLAAYWAKHPFSRDPEKVRTLLEEAVAGYPDYLENRLFFIEYYLIPAEKWAQAREEIQKVIDAPIGVAALMNGLVKIRVLDLLPRVEGK
ncbi:TPA: hypothetical protein DCY65_03165 [Candidatus Acetothermia bacterium]|nr:hypothetical protein [Candidatus Acetothermia bacterium]HAZ30554.1 hypothetical protein [Candidatus Acetothermia bacterium]